MAAAFPSLPPQLIAQYPGLNDPEYLAALLAVNPEFQVHLSNMQQNAPGLDAPHRMPQVAQQIPEAIRDGENFLVLSPLSSRWTWKKIKESPLSLPGTYVLGMVGYALSLPMRISIFVYALFKMLITFVATLLAGKCRELPDRMKKEGFFFLAATGELVSCVIGVACPLISYKFDEWIQSNPIIHERYNSAFLSFWRYPLTIDAPQSAAHAGANFGTGVDNDIKMVRKKYRVGDDIKFFKNAKVELEKYFTEEEVGGLGGPVLYNICTLGVLEAFSNGKSLYAMRDDALDKCKEHQKARTTATLDKHVETFETYWDALKKNPKENLPLIGRFFVKDTGYSLEADKLMRAIKYELILDSEREGEDVLLPDKKEELENKLKPLEQIKIKVKIEGQEKETTLRAAVKEMYKAVKGFSQVIFNTDSEMFIMVGKEAYK